MSRPREVVLNDIKIHSQYLDDALSAILHTILFVRAPNIVKPKDHPCQSLSPLIYAKCGPREVDRIIESSIEAFKASLFPSGGCLKGEVTLSFFDKQEVKESTWYMGWNTRSENVCFELWKLTIVLLDSGAGDGIAAGPQDKAAAYKSAYEQVTAAIVKVIEAANASSDHVPLSMYDYEICVTKPTPCGGPHTGADRVGEVNRVSDRGSYQPSEGGAGDRGSAGGVGGAGGDAQRRHSATGHRVGEGNAGGYR